MTSGAVPNPSNETINIILFISDTVLRLSMAHAGQNTQWNKPGTYLCWLYIGLFTKCFVSWWTTFVIMYAVFWDVMPGSLLDKYPSTKLQCVTIPEHCHLDPYHHQTSNLACLYHILVCCVDNWHNVIHSFCSWFWTKTVKNNVFMLPFGVSNSATVIS